MKCLRSGWCCTHLDVIIVNDPDKGIIDGNLIHKPCNQPCKHLVGEDPGKYSCAIHDRKWYKDTPCFAYTQIGKMDAPCRVGKSLLEKLNAKMGNI